MMIKMIKITSDVLYFALLPRAFLKIANRVNVKAFMTLVSTRITILINSLLHLV